MPRYRAYLIDQDDRVTSYQTIDAGSDEEALRAAKPLADGHDVEVGLLDRQIGKLSQRTGHSRDD